jgi:hypothetical protein
MKQFTISGLSGGYADLFDWRDAISTCKEDSKQGGFRVISDKDQKNVAVFYDGEMFIPVEGNFCESCGNVLDKDDAQLSHGLTGHFFCSRQCGIELGLLNE